MCWEPEAQAATGPEAGQSDKNGKTRLILQVESDKLLPIEYGDLAS